MDIADILIENTTFELKFSNCSAKRQLRKSASPRWKPSCKRSKKSWKPRAAGQAAGDAVLERGAQGQSKKTGQKPDQQCHRAGIAGRSRPAPLPHCHAHITKP
jgi:hypothetical protein